MIDKIVLVTRKTRLDELVERFNTIAQAKFYIEHSGGNFSEYMLEHDTYYRSLEVVRRNIELGLKIQVMDRRFVSTYLFSNHDVIVTLGQDGLVANTAKYVGAQPIVAVNPDPERFDGVLLPFRASQIHAVLERTIANTAAIRQVTLAVAELADGQRLVAFNDLFIGARTHVSARYRISSSQGSEAQSSSGIIVSTGAGSTGWLSSVFNEISGLLSNMGEAGVSPVEMEWETDRLFFVVREPFRSLHSEAGLVSGEILPQQPLILESQMPSGGVIFSDGIEMDRLEFNSGAVARISIAPEKAHLVSS